MSTDFDANISAKSVELDALIDQLETAKRSFLTVAASFVSSWYGSEAKAIVGREHAVTARLTNEQLSELKTKVQELSSSAGKLVDELLGHRELWWHQAAAHATELPTEADHQLDGRWRYSFGTGNRGNDNLADALRSALGRLAAPLEARGFLKSDSSAWRVNPNSRARTAIASPYAYPYAIDWPPEMRVAIERYAAIKTSALQKLKEIGELREEKSRLNAGNRWDEA